MDAVTRKLRRLRRGGRVRVLDLFSGCGGFSLGFHASGFEIVAAIENDPLAVRTHATNFHSSLPPPLFDLWAQPRDITKLDPFEFVNELNLGEPELAFDAIIGGPPCQSFARVGRAKLREVFDHPRAFLNDPRSNLYLRFLTFVRMLKPLVVLMENVPDIMNFGGHNIAEETSEVLEELGYNARYTLLNAANYGVPQMRERAFIIGIADQLKQTPRFPRPTHWMNFPRGYQGTRSVALRTVEPNLFDNFRFVETPKASSELLPAVTARVAIADLPRITLHLEGKLRRGARRLDNLVLYPQGRAIGDYAKMMRTWKGFESTSGILDHVIRYLPRDYAIFRRMNPGDQYPEAYAHALDLFEEALRREPRSRRPRLGSRDHVRLQRSIVPPYDPTKFPNKWRKMEADQPARTLMAHIGKDSYAHVHFDSLQARTISVREAARLQSFPDGFRFCGTMNPAFKQIGNAVPPLLARAIALDLAKTIRRGLQ